MAQILSFLIQKFWEINNEEFTQIWLLAGDLLDALKFQAETTSGSDQKLIDEKDIKIIDWIGENTHKDVMVPLSKLDRCVNPTKGEFNTISHKRKFFRNDGLEREEMGLDRSIEMTDLQMQYYLTKSERNIRNLVVKNIMAYNEEYPMDIDDKDNKFDIGQFIGGKQDGKKESKKDNKKR